VGFNRTDSVSESPLFAYDRSRGVRLIAGVDEAGRGPIAGPIMAAGVLFDLDRLASGKGLSDLEELDDSKRVVKSPAKLKRLARAVLAHAEEVSLVSLSAWEIDRIEIDPANRACLEQALRAVGGRAELRLVDGGTVPLGPEALPHERVPGGDGISASIAAASIVATEARDRLMAHLGERYPGYGFERNKGHATPEHKAALRELGPTPQHRRSFKAR
jgi:ribonuclease HII